MKTKTKWPVPLKVTTEYLQVEISSLISDRIRDFGKHVARSVHSVRRARRKMSSLKRLGPHRGVLQEWRPTTLKKLY